MGANEFIDAAYKNHEDSRPVFFLIDASDFRNKDDFLSSIRSRYGFSFEKICDSLSQLQNACLVFDQVPTRIPARSGQLTAEQIFEELAAIALAYCSSLSIILKCRMPPLSHLNRVVRLRQFDEADLKRYVQAFGDEYADVCTENAIKILHRYTDGIPTRVDKAMEELLVVPLSEVVATNTDLVSHSTSAVSLDHADPNQRLLLHLSTSEDAGIARSYELLKVLSMFPKGEQFVRIKRFYSAKGFFAEQATYLRQQGLVESTIFKPVDAGSLDEANRTLVVHKPIRETIRSLIGEDTLNVMNRRAAEIYFGNEWTSGIIRPSSSYRFDDPHCSTSDILNANAIIYRILKDAVDKQDEREIGSALGLSITYGNALLRGDHFGQSVIFVEDIIGILPKDDHLSRWTHIQIIYARGLRMIGSHEPSKRIIESLDLSLLPNEIQQRALLNLLLALEKIGTREDVERVASQIHSITRKSASSWHAKSVVIEMQADSPERIKRLRYLERYCRRQNAITVANEITLRRIALEKMSADQLVSELIPVIKSTSNQEGFYVRLRAYLKLAQIALDERGELNAIETDVLVAAYHYLFNEGLSGLFDRAHDMLWKHFSKRGEIDNLLRLYKHSALYWQFRNLKDKEIEYLNKGAFLLDANTGSGTSEIAQNQAYFRFRAKTLITPQISGPDPD